MLAVGAREAQRSGDEQRSSAQFSSVQSVRAQCDRTDMSTVCGANQTSTDVAAAAAAAARTFVVVALHACLHAPFLVRHKPRRHAQVLGHEIYCFATELRYLELCSLLLYSTTGHCHFVLGEFARCHAGFAALPEPGPDRRLTRNCARYSGIRFVVRARAHHHHALHAQLHNQRRERRRVRCARRRIFGIFYSLCVRCCAMLCGAGNCCRSTENRALCNAQSVTPSRRVASACVSACVCQMQSFGYCAQRPCVCALITSRTTFSITNVSDVHCE